VSLLAASLPAEAEACPDGEACAPIQPMTAPDPDETLRQAWALKEQCYAAWSSEPQGAVKAAQALAQLRIASTVKAHRGPLQIEVGALAAWASGVAAMTVGDFNKALCAFDDATQAFLVLDREAHAAQTQVPKVAALAMLGRYDDAIACAEEALSRFVRHGDKLGAAKINLNLGGLHERRGTYAQAVHHLREATVRFARLGDHQHSVMADIDLAKAQGAMGQFDEALHMFARARERAQRHGFPVLHTMAGELIAEIHLARGDYRKALIGFEDARRRFEELGMPQQQVGVEKQLADVYLELRMLPQALALFNVVLDRLRVLQLDEQPWALAQRGRVQALMSASDQAHASFNEASTIFTEQGNRAGEAAVALARAEVILLAGDPADATLWADQARIAYQATGSAEGMARADLVKAQALLRCGSIEQARTIFESTLAQARRLSVVTTQVRCLTGLGLCAQALGDDSYALHAFEAAIESLEIQRRALPGDDLRHAFFADQLQPYRERLRLALQKHGTTPTLENAADVLRQLERARARTLGEQVIGEGPNGNANVDASGHAPDAATRALRDRCNWLSRQLQRQHESGSASARLGEELRRTENDLLEHVRRDRLQASDPHAEDEEQGSYDFSPARLVTALARDEALIEYGVLDNELLACVVTRSGVTVHRRMAGWSATVEACRAARFQLEALRHGAAHLREHLPTLTSRTQRRLQALHESLFVPLAPSLRGCRRVLIVPCGPLARLPFAALGDGDGALVERYDLAITPSARQALHSLTHPRRRDRDDMVALGESSRLAHAATEAQLVATLFGRGRAWVGEAASLDAWHRHAPGAGMLHLACHAQFRSDNPMFSALHLHDGPLTVEAVQNTRLEASLVVLSACETGVSEVGSGEDSIGLVRAFLVAGASRVLASLWPVDDHITAAFMQAFYAAMRRGADPALALRLAQIEIKAVHPHPFYWSAFALHGGW
jgi:tetratricopeptide (TPR) repeat protein